MNHFIASAKTLIWKGLPLGLGLVAPFLCQILLARLLGAKIYGEFSYILMCLTVAAIISKAGHDYSIMKTIPVLANLREYGKIKFLISRTIRIVSVEGSVVGITFLLFVTWYIEETNLNISASQYALAFMTILVIAWSMLRRSVMLSMGRVWSSEVPENVVKPVLFVAGVWAVSNMRSGQTLGRLLALNVGITALVLAVAILVTVLLSNKSIRTAKSEWFDLSDVKSVAKTMRLGNILAIVQRNSDVILIGALTDAVTTGVYIAANRVAAIAGVVVTVLDPVVSPRIAAAFASDDRRELRSIAVSFSILSGAGAITLLSLVYFMGDRVLGLFGSEFRQGSLIALILVLGHSASSLVGPAGAFLTMTGHHKTDFKITLGSAFVYLGLLLVLVANFQAVGAAAAYAIGMWMKSVAQSIAVWRAIGINTTLFPTIGWRAI